MQEFMAVVQKKKVEYLKTKYLFGFDSSDSADVIRKLLRLKEQGAITDEEFEKLKKDVILRSGGMNIQPPSMN
jgi:hypothetical protein